MRTTRGIRNCNPGNIRKSGETWRGLKPKQSDPAFFQFVTMPYGYRALIKILQTYQDKHHCNTVRQIISRWAPDNENNTRAYIESVSKYLGVKPDDLIDTHSRQTIISLSAAISRQENGVNPNLKEICAGYELL